MWPNITQSPPPARNNSFTHAHAKRTGRTENGSARRALHGRAPATRLIHHALGARHANGALGVPRGENVLRSTSDPARAISPRAKGKGSVRCVREVREVHALSLTLTHLKYWLTHFCNNLKPDGSEAESPMVSWAPRFVEWSALVEIRAFSCVNCYWIYHVSHCTHCARAFPRS